MPQAAVKEKLVAMIGHNSPPAPTLFELSRDEIETLLIECRNWADGTTVETQAQADVIAKLKDDLRAAGKRADERRIAENEPFDAGKAEVQARYNPLIQKDKGKIALATAALNNALSPFLAKLEAAKLAIAAAARAEAEAKAKAAQDAIRAANAADLEAREKAEAMLADAKRAEAAANRAENDKAHAHGAGRAQGLRTTYRAEITDATAFARFVWTKHRDLLDWQAIADTLVRQGHHTMDGVTVHADRSL